MVDNAHVITSTDGKVAFSAWRLGEQQGHINIGHNCLVCPGVRLDSANEILIVDNIMLAAGVYITDADWHDIYDGTRSTDTTRPVTYLPM
ncbi:MAG: hypothetical protein KDI36_18040 [Pseudomonadales bacterium]|nr:hypothetical protein [Pseudomonadales bacterium]